MRDASEVFVVSMGSPPAAGARTRASEGADRCRERPRQSGRRVLAGRACHARMAAMRRPSSCSTGPSRSTHQGGLSPRPRRCVSRIGPARTARRPASERRCRLRPASRRCTTTWATCTPNAATSMRRSRASAAPSAQSRFRRGPFQPGNDAQAKDEVRARPPPHSRRRCERRRSLSRRPRAWATCGRGKESTSRPSRRFARCSSFAATTSRSITSWASCWPGCAGIAEAEACYREAIRIRPDYPDAHNNLGNALRNQGKLDQALVAFREALRLRPDYPEAYNNVGIVLKHLGKIQRGGGQLRAGAAAAVQLSGGAQQPGPGPGQPRQARRRRRQLSAGGPAQARLCRRRTPTWPTP